MRMWFISILPALIRSSSCCVVISFGMPSRFFVGFSLLSLSLGFFGLCAFAYSTHVNGAINTIIHIIMVIIVCIMHPFNMAGLFSPAVFQCVNLAYFIIKDFIKCAVVSEVAERFIEMVEPYNHIQFLIFLVP